MRAGVVALIIGITTRSFAQPAQSPAAPAPAPGSVPQVAPAPAAPAPVGGWYRFTLTDGRVVDAQLVGGDAFTHFIQTPAGTYSLPRAQIVSMLALQQGAFGPPVQGAVVPAPPMPMAAPAPSDGTTHSRAPGVMMFATSYGITALVAYNRTDNDPDARWGYLPIVGPIIWTASDDGKWGEDGWDWLGALSSLSQAAGLYGMIAGMEEKKRRGLFGVTPVRTSTFRGLALGGTF